ncbi:MAG: DUF4276 family protein [Gammaproteobacteria bacterium]|nr:DUF4276 family protein [Gammaproteobacteria bacterium]
MKIILFVEGHTENKAIPSFLKRWLDPQLSKPVGIKSVRFEGWAELVKDSPSKAELYLSQDGVIAVIALLDLYGPAFYPNDKNTATERYTWAKRHLEGKVNRPNFFQFFAVHEVEAWLLCAPSIFPNSVRPLIEKISQSPEAVNNAMPPAKRLNDIYQKKTKMKIQESRLWKRSFFKT